MILLGRATVGMPHFFTSFSHGTYISLPLPSKLTTGHERHSMAEAPCLLLPRLREPASMMTTLGLYRLPSVSFPLLVLVIPSLTV